MVKIGDGDLLEYYTLLIPEDSTVRIPLDVKGWKFDLDIKFDNTSEERGVDITKTNDGATLVFRKWDNSLGTALLKPHLLATLQDGQAAVARRPRQALLHGQQLCDWRHQQTRSATSLARSVVECRKEMGILT